MLWRLGVVLMAFVSLCMGALSAFALWVLFGFPIESHRHDANAPGLRVEAANGEALGRSGPLKAAEPPRQDFGRTPSTASLGSSLPAECDHDACASGSSAGAPEQQNATQTSRPDISGALTDSRAPMRCDADRCAAKYKSFDAADCTYQPYGGGPRSLCELSTLSADAPPPQTSRVQTGPMFGATDTRSAERAGEAPKSATPVPAVPQCNVNLCAATRRTFNAADCTYQPYGGGPRRICEQ